LCAAWVIVVTVVIGLLVIIGIVIVTVKAIKRRRLGHHYNTL